MASSALPVLICPATTHGPPPRFLLSLPYHDHHRMSRTQAFDQAAPVSDDSSPTPHTPSLIAVDERAVKQHETILLSRLFGPQEGSKTNECKQTFKTVLRWHVNLITSLNVI
ncbi:hypothetical protein J5N97_000661 [Dioscorea zingiberensis]|uniref:Uncharacterized protein n=1 Tax=Dioscorea zingiberensis TaxID=325984 RepID=A0A9D5H2Y2_9LILI|nr:hypothetical protein J5N97_000661 [Dioscorea zingiberensis]